MKKSQIYKYAQLVIAETDELETSVKLEILRELMEQEDLAKFVEEQEAGEAE